MKNITYSFLLLICSATIIYCQNDTIKATYKGYEDIREHVQRNVRYPQYAAENNIVGTVFYSFKVTKSGCLDSILFRQSPDKSFNKEIEKVLLKMNCKWKPAYYKNEPIDIWINSKAVFQLR